MIYIYSSDLKQQLTTHDVTWSKRDRYCADPVCASTGRVPHYAGKNGDLPAPGA